MGVETQQFDRVCNVATAKAAAVIATADTKTGVYSPTTAMKARVQSKMKTMNKAQRHRKDVVDNHHHHLNDILPACRGGGEGSLRNETTLVPDVPKEGENNVTDTLASTTATAPSTPTVTANTNGTKYVFPLLKDGSNEGAAMKIPERYLKMHNWNQQKAQASVESTLSWRKEHEVDSILGRPYPDLELFKALVPHGFLGRNPQGHVIFCMRSGYLNFDLIKQHSISHDAMVMHYVYVLEYLWNIEDPSENATMMFVLDLSGVSLNKIRKSVGFIKQFVSTIDQHYPQRAHKTLLVNVPRWFGIIWKAISPFMRESTKALIEMHSCGDEQTKALQSALGKENVPEEILQNKPQSAPLLSSIQEEFESFVSVHSCCVSATAGLLDLFALG